MYIRLSCAATPKSSTPHSHRQTDLSCASSPASQTSLYSLSALQQPTPATSMQTPLSAVLANSQFLSVSSQPSSPSTSQRQLNSHCHRFASLSQPTSSESQFHLSASLQMSPPSDTHISTSPQGSSPSDTQSYLSKSSQMSLPSDAQSHFSTSPQMSSPSDTQNHLFKSSQVSLPSDAQSHFSTSPQMSPPSDAQSHFSISPQMSSPSDTQSHLSKSSQVSLPSDAQSHFSTSSQLSPPSDTQSHFSISPQMSSPSDTQSNLSKSSQVSLSSDTQSHFSTSPQVSPPSDTQSHFSTSPQMSSLSDTQSHLSASPLSPSSPLNSPQSIPDIYSILNPDNPSVQTTDSKDQDFFNPIYPGATITLCAALCAIMQFATSNRLSYTAIGQLLQLLQLVCPNNNNLPTSFYHFRSFFKKFASQHQQTKVCGECELPSQQCQCTEENKKLGHLVSLSILKPLRTILSSKLHSHYSFLNITAIFCVQVSGYV